MVGCFGRADPSQTIRLDLDNELESARWFTKAEIRAIMADPEGTVGNRHDPKEYFDVRRPRFGLPDLSCHSGSSVPSFRRMADLALTPPFGPSCARQQDGKLLPGPPPSSSGPEHFKLPPTTAIAGVLTRAWATDDVAGWAAASGEPTRTVDPRL